MGEEDSNDKKPRDAIRGWPAPAAPQPVQPQSGETIGREAFETWVRAPLAYSTLVDHYGSVDIAISSIFRRVTNGLLRAASELAVWEECGKRREDEYSLISAKLWIVLSPGYQAHLWKNGEIDALLSSRRGGYVTVDDPTVTLIDVRFEPSGLDKMLGRSAERAAPPGPSPQARKGGRPPKTYWEDVLIHFFDEIYRGDLKPKNQAELEDTMASWISEMYNETPSEAIIRTRAVKLWSIYKN
jgi:hypothetical protein